MVTKIKIKIIRESEIIKNGLKCDTSCQHFLWNLRQKEATCTLFDQVSNYKENHKDVKRCFECIEAEAAM